MLDLEPFLVSLQILHGGCALHLLSVQRPGYEADENRKQDDGDAKHVWTMSKDVVDPQQYTGKYGNEKIPHSSSYFGLYGAGQAW